jgi:cytochrome o ubiquinol oxidase operon protein cyoD
MNNTVHDNNHGSGHGSLSSYILGFILSIIMTIIPYYVVVNHSFSNVIIYVVISIFAILQLLIQLVFFLHLGSESKPRWNLTVFLFILLIVGILVVGSLWIMYNLDYNMMDEFRMYNSH